MRAPDVQAEHVDVVVVGSGFGGSVSAFRFAEAGRSVVVLERGGTFPPGSFPRDPAGVARNVWDPSEGRYGMVNVWSFRGLEAVVASGLGGGSLIYANVLIRKDEKWFVRSDPLPGGGYETWPVTRDDLDPHYDRVETMLGGDPYPYADSTPKTAALRDAARRKGLRWELPLLAVSFRTPAGDPVPGAPIAEPAYGNLHGLPRRTCVLCGECCIGCNDGAKNTLDHTYLSAAVHHGADVRTGREVKGFAPLPGGGFEVRYLVHDPIARSGGLGGSGVSGDSGGTRARTITCDRLVLAAGALGSTFLLLRNRGAFPGLSSALGTRFSGNGDLLGLVLSATTPDGRPLRTQGSRGPVITSAVRVPDGHDVRGHGARGHYVEDAGYPPLAEWLVEGTQVVGVAGRVGRFVTDRVHAALHRDARSDISRDLARLIGEGRVSGSSMALLGMGRDVPDGVMRLRDGWLDVDWTTETSRDYFEGVHATMRGISDALGADFAENPLWRLGRVVTVHPLGGAPMGGDARQGVCDAYGEVFGYPGLYVADGAVMPGPVGPNPSLTIAALADRMCDRILEGP